MSNKFKDKVKELGVNHLFGIVRKPSETDEQFKVRCEYIKFRNKLGV